MDAHSPSTYPALCTGCEQHVYEDASSPACPRCFPPARRYSVRFLRSDMRVRTVTGMPVLAGALDLARELVLDVESTLIAAQVYDGARLLSTVSVFDEIVDDWFAFESAVRTS